MLASMSNKTKATDINQKICWGIKRNDNHEQPDLGKENTELIKKYNGIAMGNKDSTKIYWYGHGKCRTKVNISYI